MWLFACCFGAAKDPSHGNKAATSSPSTAGGKGSRTKPAAAQPGDATAAIQTRPLKRPKNVKWAASKEVEEDQEQDSQPSSMDGTAAFTCQPCWADSAANGALLEAAECSLKGRSLAAHRSNSSTQSSSGSGRRRSALGAQEAHSAEQQQQQQRELQQEQQQQQQQQQTPNHQGELPGSLGCESSIMFMGACEASIDESMRELQRVVSYASERARSFRSQMSSAGGEAGEAGEAGVACVAQQATAVQAYEEDAQSCAAAARAAGSLVMLSALRRLCSSDQPSPTAHSTPGTVGSLPAISHALILPVPEPVASTTGPEDGVGHLPARLNDWSSAPAFQPPAGTSSRLSGACASLYDINPETGKHNGDPIADCFGALGFQEGALLALADGVSWGERPKTAAHAAVYGFLRHMHGALVGMQGDSTPSSDELFSHMVAAGAESGQKLVVQLGGTLTTLVGALVCPLAKHPGGWAVLALEIGDSPAYVWRHADGEVEEITHVSSGQPQHRNPRNCPGALGFALGEAPDLSNLLCCITTIEDDDVVFLTSDGVSDNFDPVLRMEATQAAPPLVTSPAHSTAAPQPGTPGALPALDPSACHSQALHTMAKVLRAAAAAQQGPLSAAQLCAALLEHVTALTTPQRALIEGAKMIGVPEGGGKGSAATEALVEQVRKSPGKLDHACVVAYQAGRLVAQ